MPSSAPLNWKIDWDNLQAIPGEKIVDKNQESEAIHTKRVYHDIEMVLPSFSLFRDS